MRSDTCSQNCNDTTLPGWMTGLHISSLAYFNALIQGGTSQNSVWLNMIGATTHLSSCVATQIWELVPEQGIVLAMTYGGLSRWPGLTLTRCRLVLLIKPTPGCCEPSLDSKCLTGRVNVRHNNWEMILLYQTISNAIWLFRVLKFSVFDSEQALRRRLLPPVLKAIPTSMGNQRHFRDAGMAKLLTWVLLDSVIKQDFCITLRKHVQSSQHLPYRPLWNRWPSHQQTL